MERNEKPVVALLLGDGSGVGPELVVKLAVSGILETEARTLLVGDARLFQMALARAGAKVDWKPFDTIDAVDWDHGLPLLSVGEQDPEQFRVGEVSELCGSACIQMIRKVTELFQAGKIDGVCYAPLNKRAMKLAHNPAASETELFAQLLGQEKGYGEINMLDRVWTTRVTSHIPIREVSEHLTVDAIADSIELAWTTVRRAGLEEPRIGVCALNPHGGEGGLCGDEEIRVIAPAIELIGKNGWNVQGPFPADTLFKRAFDGEFDGIVTMYHDQGQIALKLRGFERGITIGGGLLMPATTCAHGTAHDIAGKGIASPVSLENAYRMACVMAAHPVRP